MNLIELTQKLISYKSYSLQCNEIMDFISVFLTKNGFEVQSINTGETNQYKNIIAKIGVGKGVCFAAHVDVVTEGNRELWKTDPFSGNIIDGKIFGRGVCDMKGGLSCFIDAVLRIKESLNYSITIVITCDEEIGGNLGAKIISNQLKDEYKLILIGEPTNPSQMGQIIKNGRRGLLDLDLIIYGKSGHTAYHDKAINAAMILSRIISVLPEYLDNGTDKFSPSSLQITNIFVENKLRNVVPDQATASINIRYNNLWDLDKIKFFIEDITNKYSNKFELKVIKNNSYFYSEPEKYINILAKSVEKTSGRLPELNTTGGISDARYFMHLAPTFEYGLISNTIHQENESIFIDELVILSNTYYDFLKELNCE